MAEVTSDRPKNMVLDQLSNEPATKDDETNNPFKISHQKLRGLEEKLMI
jgi:hypothetical protein